MTTVGYVGLDHHHARPYLRTLESLSIDVTSVCAPGGVVPDDMPAIDGANVCDDPVGMFDAEDMDVVWLTLSNQNTPAVIEAAIDRGIDVFAEKPAARTAADLEPVARAAATADATVCVGYAWRGHPVARRLRDLSSTGFFGERNTFETRFLASSLAHRDADHYLFDRAASRGGVLQWLGVHWIDLVPWILDDPIATVNAQLVPAADDRVGVEAVATLQLRTHSGAVGTLNCGYQLREGRYDTSIRVTGDAGRAVWDPIGETFGFDGQTHLELESASVEWASTPRRTTTYDYEPAAGYGGYWGREFVERFLDARLGKNRNPAGLGDALRVLRVLDAAYESARTGEPIAVDS